MVAPAAMSPAFGRAALYPTILVCMALAYGEECPLSIHERWLAVELSVRVYYGSLCAHVLITVHAHLQESRLDSLRIMWISHPAAKRGAVVFGLHGCTELLCLKYLQIVKY